MLKGSLHIWKANNFWHLGFKHIKVEPPAFFFDIKRLREKTAQGGIIDMCRKLVEGMRTFFDFVQIDLSHGVDVLDL